MKQAVKNLLVIPFLFGFVVFLFLDYFYIQAKRWLGKMGGKLGRKNG